MLIACPQCQGVLAVLTDPLPMPGAVLVCPHCQCVLFTHMAETEASPKAALVVPPRLRPVNGEATRQAAVDDGRVAAREITEMRGYDKWHSGVVLGSEPVFSRVSSRRSWLGLLGVCLLCLALFVQVIYAFRSDLAFRIPAFHPFLQKVCVYLSCTLPPLVYSEALLLEATDLQADPVSGRVLHLQTTLKNQAPFAQDWPRLELSLLDSESRLLTRRVFSAAEYLPESLANTPLFPADQSVSLHLSLSVDAELPEGENSAVATYRLYAFYP